MPIESGTHINQLNASNPPGTDGLAEADDHLRKIKLALTTDLPNIGGAVSATHTVINAALTLDPGGVARVVAVGSIHAFPKAPTGLGAGASGTGHTYLELDGSVWTIADFPTLGAFYGSTFGGNGTTTFGVPDWKTAGKFPRSRTGSVAVGTAQTNQNKTHTHGATLTGTAASGGSHSHTGGTNSTTPGAPSIGISAANLAIAGTTAAQAYSPNDAGAGSSTSNINMTGTAHTHTFTTDAGGGHTHTVSVGGTTDADGGTEARPEAYAVIYCCKT